MAFLVESRAIRTYGDIFTVSKSVVFSKRVFAPWRFQRCLQHFDFCVDCETLRLKVTNLGSYGVFLFWCHINFLPAVDEPQAFV